MEETPFDIIESSYFQTLPEYVQETLMQCDPGITDENELRETAENLMNKQGK